MTRRAAELQAYLGELSASRLARLIFLILPALIIIAVAVPRFTEGFALEQAFPESALLTANYALPKASYVRLDRILARAPMNLPGC